MLSYPHRMCNEMTCMKPIATQRNKTVTMLHHAVVQWCSGRVRME